jgi:hypothetical protein
LDETLLAPEPAADKVGQPQPAETVVMPPGTPVAERLCHKDSDCQKQDRLQSWDEYFAAGEALILKLPKRKEGSFVEAFVDGMYDDYLRRKCGMMLDEVGWSWENLKNFIIKTSSTQIETQARQPTAPLSHRHRKGEVCPICSNKVNNSQPGDRGNETRNSPSREPLQQPVQFPLTADARRRSQRIHGQRQPSPVRTKNVAKPKLSKGRMAKHVHMSQTVAQGIPVQAAKPEEAQTNVKATKHGPAASEPGEATITRARGMVLRTPGGEAEQKNLEAVHQNGSVSEECQMTPDGPRSRTRAPALETQPLHLAKFQPVTPTNGINHHRRSNALANSDTDAPTWVRDAPNKHDCKKRKLVQELEIPDTTREDLVTPLGREIKQTEPDERDRKERRRMGKRKRVAVPIPLIPIVPLSDDE